MAPLHWSWEREFFCVWASPWFRKCSKRRRFFCNRQHLLRRWLAFKSERFLKLFLSPIIRAHIAPAARSSPKFPSARANFATDTLFLRAVAQPLRGFVRGRNIGNEARLAMAVAPKRDTPVPPRGDTRKCHTLPFTSPHSHPVLPSLSPAEQHLEKLSWSSVDRLHSSWWGQAVLWRAD